MSIGNSGKILTIMEKINAKFNLLGILIWNLIRYYFKPGQKYIIEQIIQNTYWSFFLGGAQKYIQKISRTGKYYKIKTKICTTDIFWPVGLNLKSFYFLLNETAEPQHFHRYENKQAGVRKGDSVVDCGAAEGLFSASILDKASKIYLIEPLPVFVVALNKTFIGQPKCHIFPVAVGAKKGIVYLSDFSVSSQIIRNKKNAIKVAMTTIDDLFYKRNIKIDFLKADIEGAEQQMLLGAQKTIAQMKPKLALASYHGEDNVTGIINLVKKLNPGYKYLAKGISLLSGKPVMLHFWNN